MYMSMHVCTHYVYVIICVFRSWWFFTKSDTGHRSVKVSVDDTLISTMLGVAARAPVVPCTKPTGDERRECGNDPRTILIIIPFPHSHPLPTFSSRKLGKSSRDGDKSANKHEESSRINDRKNLKKTSSMVKDQETDSKSNIHPSSPLLPLILHTFHCKTQPQPVFGGHFDASIVQQNGRTLA